MGGKQSVPVVIESKKDRSDRIIQKNDDESSTKNESITPSKTTAATTLDEIDEVPLGGFFRGIAVAARAKLPALKAVTKSAIRTAGTNRPLAFASEGAVAGKNVLPTSLYYGAWGLSGLAIASDITLKTWEAPTQPVDKRRETMLYYTAFHIPASLVIPAYLIHQVVHYAEYSLKHHSYAKRIPLRMKPFFPVGVALASIIPIVPTVDHLAEALMEPTLGKYLGLEFHHHHHHEEEVTKKQKKE